MVRERSYGFETGPLPRRSAVGLWCQFYLQWIYIPLGVIALVALFVASVLGGDASGFGGGGRGRRRVAGVPDDPYESWHLTRRQYRLERFGSQEEWAVRADLALRRAVALTGESTSKSVELPVRTWRRVGIAGVEELAVPLGWRVDWGRTRFGMGKTVFLAVGSGKIDSVLAVVDPSEP